MWIQMWNKYQKTRLNKLNSVKNKQEAVLNEI